MVCAYFTLFFPLMCCCMFTPSCGFVNLWEPAREGPVIQNMCSQKFVCKDNVWHPPHPDHAQSSYRVSSDGSFLVSLASGMELLLSTEPLLPAGVGGGVSPTASRCNISLPGDHGPSLIEWRQRKEQSKTNYSTYERRLRVTNATPFKSEQIHSEAHGASQQGARYQYVWTKQIIPSALFHVAQCDLLIQHQEMSLLSALFRENIKRYTSINIKVQVV